jgi:hypothetical protein
MLGLMTRSKKIFLGGILGVVLLVVAYFGWPFIFFGIAAWRDVRHSNQERVQLLYRTDHVALLAACREVMTNRHTFTRDKDWHGTEGSDESFIDPKDPRVPAVISALQPRDVIASDTQVHLELHGGFDHYGVIALSEEEARSQTNSFAGPFELIPGLWYYDEGLVYDRAAWLKKLRGMKPNDAPAPKW